MVNGQWSMVNGEYLVMGDEWGRLKADS